MAKVLCWEERSNGRYCKNYRLNGQNKCRSHCNYTGEGVENFIMLLLMSYITLLGILYYGGNSEMIDNYIYSINSFIIEHVKEPIRQGLLELYKQYPLYMNNISMYFSKILN